MIRKFEPRDTDAVIDAWRRASALAHPFLSGAFLAQEEENIRDRYLALAEIWVTVVDGAVVGFMALIDNEIGGLFLDPAYHGRGLGRALVDKAVAEKGTLTVEVFKDNALGRRFYTRYGFRGTETYVHEASGQTVLHQTFTPAA